MFLGVIFVAVAAILNRIKPSRRNDRRRPRRRKLRKGRRNRSRPQFKRPVSVEESVTNNDISTTEDANANVNTTDRGESLRGNDAASLVVEIEQAPTSSGSSSDNTAENTNCNVCDNENKSSTDLPTASKESAKHATDASKNKNSSREVSSDKSVNRSDKCLEAVSRVTDDSGYTENSVNSMKSRLVENTSISNPSNYAVSGSGLSTSLNDEKKKKACCDDDYDFGEIANMSYKKNAPLINMDLPCFSLTGVGFNDCAVDDKGHQGRDGDDDCNDNSSNDSFKHNPSNTSSSSENKTAKSDDVDELEALYVHAQNQGIVLEDVECTQDGSTAVGTVLVRNECFEKHVGVRHSSDSWDSYQDTAAEWVETIEGGDFDRFKFRVNLPRGSYRMELAFFFNQYWDNNDTQNHIISCTIF